jgi:hypothetical protein
MLMCHNMPPLEQGHAYQVWFVRGNERVSGGLIWPDHYGNGYAHPGPDRPAGLRFGGSYRRARLARSGQQPHG